MQHEDNHGQSPAAWTGVAIMLVAAVVACWGVFSETDVLLWGGVAVFLLGAVIWYLMDRAGKGRHDDDPERTGRRITPPASARGGQAG